MYRKVLELDSKVLEIARELYEKRSLLIMGRGFNFATCLEGALKVGRSGVLSVNCERWRGGGGKGERGRKVKLQGALSEAILPQHGWRVEGSTSPPWVLRLRSRPQHAGSGKGRLSAT